MEINYLIESQTLDKLKLDIIEAVKLIKQHIEDRHPILVRHHSDADGFSGGIAIERAILPLIYDTHSRERDMWGVYSRKPNMAPYYSYEDVNKDLAFFLSDKGKYEYKKPLVIIIDNGSSDQDVLALKKLKIYGIKTIVIDHHPASKSAKELIDTHINPHNVGSTYDFSAGMLCAEIAAILNPNVEDMPLIAAISAYADKVKSKEKDEYSKLAHKKGYTDNYIKEMAEILDFEAGSLGFTDSKNLLDDFFGKDKEKQKMIVDMLKVEVERKRKDALESAKKYSHVSKTQNINLVLVPMTTISFRGEYPPLGKIVGMMHDFVSKQEDSKPTVSLGLADSMITIRSTSDSNVDVNEIIKAAKQRFPYAQIQGGGHAKAGSIKFIPAAYEEVKEFVLHEVRK